MLMPVAFGFRWATAALLAATLLGLSQEPGSLQLRDSEGRLVEPLNTPKIRAAVFLFTRADCPISNRYAPEIRRLFEHFEPEGIRFWLVYVDPDETAESVKRHLAKYGYPSPALLDPQHRLVRFAGAAVTPEAAVYLSDGQLVYRGRIDNRYVDFGQYRPTATEHDLEEILESVATGKIVRQKFTKAVGCFISDLQ